MPVSQRFLFALLLLASAVPVIITYFFPFSVSAKFVLVIIALLFDLLAFSTKFYTRFFVPFLKMKNRTVVLRDSEAFTMAPSGNAIVVRNGDDIFASAFIKIPTYRSATEMSTEEKVDFSRLFGRVLTLTKNVVRFATQLYVIDKDAYIGNIRNKLNEAEERYQNASLNKDISKAESERIRGEVTMWHNLFDNVSKTRSQSLEAYAMVTAQGGSEEEAVNLALQQADEMATGISAVFGISASIAEGEEMLKFIEPDYMIPIVTISEQMREQAVSGEI